MQSKRGSRRWTDWTGEILVPLLVAYAAGYVSLRASHTLIRAGCFYNRRDASGRLSPEARWLLTIQSRRGPRGGRGLVTLYRPLIQLELLMRPAPAPPP